ncbi:acyltransferase-domain-containing protein [Lineolata rhizophorae]|uniref:Acyltransferase-domain-containing protein n=1 Tax=Lineolata rhizophorae TaxID=578093 RepID=A0A6A6P3D5_9PEZI|nr:acyltransferase-domain-containing protein [Lineolata rhizophorae]
MMAPNPPQGNGDAQGLLAAASNMDPKAVAGQNANMSPMDRMISAGSTLLSGAMAISASQFMGAPLKLISEEYYKSYMSITKQAFAILITTITQMWSPTVVRVTGDASMKDQLQQRGDGALKCNFPSRILLMANHQLYTDWLYLWWIAYTNGMHGHIYIILKESIKNIPIFGWSAQFYNFIFLARDWKKDKPKVRKCLQQLNNNDPMWLLIFPEGTNLSKSTREASRAWAQKNGVEDMKHQLLPRTTGIQFCLQELRQTTDWLYDCTIAYEGVPPGQFGQDIFTLRSSLLEGKPPKSVNMHWRRFKIADIPVDNSKAFEVWLRNRWREKDYLLEYFQRTKRFPSEEFWKTTTTTGANGGARVAQTGIDKRKAVKPAPYVETEVKSGSWEEFLSLFAPITAFIAVLFLFYSDPKHLLNAGQNGANDPAAQQAQLIQSMMQAGEPPSDEKKKQALLSAIGASQSNALLKSAGAAAGRGDFGTATPSPSTTKANSRGQPLKLRPAAPLRSRTSSSSLSSSAAPHAATAGTPVAKLPPEQIEQIKGMLRQRAASELGSVRSAPVKTAQQRAIGAAATRAAAAGNARRASVQAQPRGNDKATAGGKGTAASTKGSVAPARSTAASTKTGVVQGGPKKLGGVKAPGNQIKGGAQRATPQHVTAAQKGGGGGGGYAKTPIGTVKKPPTAQTAPGQQKKKVQQGQGQGQAQKKKEIPTIKADPKVLARVPIKEKEVPNIKVDEKTREKLRAGLKK